MNRIMLQEDLELWPLPWEHKLYKEAFWVYYNSMIRLYVARWCSSQRTNIIEYFGTHERNLIEDEDLTDENILTFIQEWYWKCLHQYPTYK